MPQHRADMFLPADQDPRATEGVGSGDEKQNLIEFLRYQRQTLELKCAGLDADQLARRAVPPSTMSLLGLVRHLADVEHGWFRQILAGEDVPRIYRSEAEPDADFDGAVGDPAVVADAWDRLHEAQAFSDSRIEAESDLGRVFESRHGPMTIRELLVHMVEEYARHNGHADLLRELIDGRIGE